MRGVARRLEREGEGVRVVMKLEKEGQFPKRWVRMTWLGHSPALNLSQVFCLWKQEMVNCPSIKA